MDATPDPLGQDLSPLYELGAQLGRGGYGAVHRAREVATGREVAIKLLVERGLVAVERFGREASLTARLDHPGIVRVHAAGTFAGRPCIVYELVDGAPLADVMRTADLRTRVELVRDAARAVGFAHRHGVVHRDLKVDNVLVDRDGHVRVADFGLALSDEADRLTRTGALLGTPTHMAPEMFTDGARGSGPQADVWSLGVVLFEALTGELPFEGSTLISLVERIEAGPPAPRTIDRAIPRALEGVCLRALSRDRAQRPQDGDAFADALDQALAARPERTAGLFVALLALAAVLGGIAIALRSAAPPPLPGPGTVGSAPGAPRPSVLPAPPVQAPEGARPPAPTIRAGRIPGDGGRWAVWVDGTHLLIGGPNSAVQLRDVTTDETTRSWDVRSGAARLLSDGRVLLVVDRGLLRVIDPTAGTLIALPGPARNVVAITSAANAPVAAVILRDGATNAREVQLVDVTRGELRALEGAPLQTWDTLALSPDGRWLALGDDPPAARINTLCSVYVFDLRAEPGATSIKFNVLGSARVLAFEPSGRRVFGGTTGGSVFMFDLVKKGDPTTFLPRALRESSEGVSFIAHPAGKVRGLAISRDGRRLVSAADYELEGELTAIEWDLASGEDVHTFRAPGRVRTLDLSPDGAWLAIGILEGGVIVRGLGP